MAAGNGRSGRGLAVLALIISLIALVASLMAYHEVGGTNALRSQVERLQSGVDTARKETADALQRIEQSIRPAERAPAPSAQGTGK